MALVTPAERSCMVMDGTLNPKQNCPFHFISLIGRYVYLELFKKFEWSKVASLALNGHKYSEYISHLQDVLQENDVTFLANRKFPVESPDMSMVSRVPSTSASAS